MASPLILVCIVSCLVSIAVGQSGPLIPYMLNQEQLRTLRLIHSPELLELAAKFNERILVRIEGPFQPVVVQENVNANFDCLPWLSNFPGGTIRWLLVSLDSMLMASTPIRETEIVDTSGQPNGRFLVGGKFNRWFNITSTILTAGAGDPHYGNYTCEVCVARGTRQQMCHRATTTLFIAGSPPNILEGEDNAGPTTDMTSNGVITRRYDIGTDFCINENDNLRLTISCAIAQSPAVEPPASRSFSKNTVEIYSGLASVSPTLNTSFFLPEENQILSPTEIFPIIISVDNSANAGLVVLNTEVANVSATAMFIDMGLEMDVARRMVINAIIGNYECLADNIYGSDSAVTTIRVCEGAPTFTGCLTDVVFPQDRALVPVGCTICIRKGSSVTLDCAASTGTVSYVWTNPQGIMTETQRLTVTMEGTYTCRASNLDTPNVTRTSVIVFSDAVEFGGRIIGRNDNGCDRLLQDLNDPDVDLCAFVGEELELNCINRDTGEILNPVFPDMTLYGDAPRVVNTAMFEGAFQCRLNTSNVCGQTPTELNVRVFDPARIDRSSILPVGSFGAGRSAVVQEVSAGATVMLSCPANGVDTPNTEWFFVMVTDNGCTMEIFADNITGVSSSTTNGNSDLTIANFQSDDNGGTYVCRTDNIAGSDAGVVVLSEPTAGAAWVIDNDFGECTMMCMDGMKARSVSCRDSDLSLLPNLACDGLERPASVENCATEFPNECLLTPIFVHGDYQPCSEGCSGGFQIRDVFCVLPITREILKEYECFPLRRPRRRRLCPNTCCKEDLRSDCSNLPKALCAMASFQQLCCWYCLDN